MPDDDFELSDAIFSRAYPNPDRLGCPSGQVLSDLARRKIPIGDPAYAHLAHCSPCYVEFREFQKKLPQRSSALARWGAVAAALVVALGALVWMLARPETRLPFPGGLAQFAVIVDLRPYAPSRGEGGPAPAPPAVRRSAKRVALLLPVGSQEGRYEMQILDADLKPRLSDTLTATIRDGMTVISAALDLQKLAPGNYSLGLRRGDGEWLFCPLRIE